MNSRKRLSLFLKQIQDWVIKPSKYVTDPSERIRAELSATSTLFFTLLTLAGTLAASGLAETNRLGVTLLAVLTIVIFSGYLLSRSRYYYVSGLLIISLWTIASLSYVYSGRTTNGPAFAILSLIPFGFILGYYILLRTRNLVIAIGINILGVLLLPVFEPQASGRIFDTTAGVLVAMGGLTLIAQRHRDQLERARLKVMSEVNRELTLLGNVRTAMAQELELSALLRNVVESIADSFGYALVSLYLLEEDALILQHQVGYERVISKIALTQGVMGRAVRMGEPILLENVQTDPQFLEAIEDIVSEICVPLFDEGRVVGALNVESTKGIKLTEADMKLLAALSEHIGIAIGQARLYSSVQQELDARKQAQEELRKSEAGSRALFNQSHDAVFFLNLKGNHITANQRAADMLGYSVQEIQALSVYDTSAELPKSENMISRLMNGEHIPTYERFFRKKNGEIFPVEINLELVQTDDGQPLHIQSVVRDVSARKQAEKERENLIAELSAKNAEMERFVYTASHDLKSPLVTINGFLGYLKGDTASGNSERVAIDIQRIQDAVEKMHILLRDLLELSRVGRVMNSPETIQLDDLAREALEIVHGQLETRGVTVQIQPNLPAIYGDRQRLIEVLQNLIDNAAKYMGAQSAPRIEIGQHEEGDGKFIFYVKDNGIGIPPEHQERIFGLFDKLDPKSEGAGVGLALVKRIIEIHGGRLWVESETGQGSTFYFTLPRVNQ